MRPSIEDALAIHRLVVDGAGLGCLSAELCAADFDGVGSFGCPGLDDGLHRRQCGVSEHRQISLAVRAFVDVPDHASTPGTSWQGDPLVP
jgi:LysR family transcriptional regulator for bpeEF and oprC